MKIKDVVSATSTFLGKDYVNKYLDGNVARGDEVQIVDKLVRLANLVISELSASCVFAVTTESVNFSGGKAQFSVLSNTPLKIVGVTDQNGKQLDFSTDGVNIFCTVSNGQVTYEYYPYNMGLEDSIQFSNSRLSVHAVAMGVTAEYCLTVADFDSAVMWHERFIDQLKKIVTIKNASIRQRDWE